MECSCHVSGTIPSQCGVNEEGKCQCDSQGQCTCKVRQVSIYDSYKCQYDSDKCQYVRDSVPYKVSKCQCKSQYVEDRVLRISVNDSLALKMRLGFFFIMTFFFSD